VSLCATASFAQTGSESASVNPYPLIFSESFEDTSATKALWSAVESCSFCGGRAGKGILIENSVPGASKIIATPLSLKNVRGNTIALAADIKAERVSLPPNSWNGIKVMLRIDLDNGKSVWPQVAVGVKTFDWFNKSALITVPSNAAKVLLELGLEQSTGKVWFDGVTVRLLINSTAFPPPRDQAIPIEKFHSLPALRGAMVATSITQDGLRVLGKEWNANIIRWQLGGWDPAKGLTKSDYDVELENELKKLDNILGWCREYGLMVVVDLHSLSRMCFINVAAQNKLIETWEKIAARYRNEGSIWAYDIVNEPTQREHSGADGVLIWEDLAEKVAHKIRLVDPVKPIIVESLFAGPEGFHDLRPLDFSIPRIIYSAHMYTPTAFTHQGVHPEDSIPCVYPGTINGTLWDKDRLIDALKPVKEFQDKYRVPVFIGEFGAVRWAPSNSAYNYLKDCIDIFELYGWDWCYHAFREWQGWSVEHNEDRNNLTLSEVSNKRQQLLRMLFKKNIKPISGANNTVSR
jgi:endoglucanase